MGGRLSLRVLTVPELKLSTKFMTETTKHVSMYFASLGRMLLSKKEINVIRTTVSCWQCLLALALDNSASLDIVSLKIMFII